MPRADQRDTDLRRSLETIGCEAAAILTAWEFARLRISQAITRTGLTGLLSPALDELDEIKGSVGVVQSQVDAALARLMERADVN